MRNANHYARTPELAAMRPADRVVHPIDARGLRAFWTNAELDTAGIQRFPDGKDIEECIHSEITGPSTALPVHANHGRWCVTCPCGGGQLAHPDDRRFLCVDCGNEWNDYRWCPVLWPDDWAEVEVLLNDRQQQWANWNPGEDTAKLADENNILSQMGGLRR